MVEMLPLMQKETIDATLFTGTKGSNAHFNG